MSDTPPQPEDELKGSEQPFVAHLIELRDRLIWAVAAVAVAAAALAIYPGPGNLYDILAAPLVVHLPKGATLSHHNILNNGFQVGSLLNYTSADRVCIPVPL
jgi:sec-independent protein translocase protein TatC